MTEGLTGSGWGSGRYLSWPQAGSWLSQLGLVLVQSVLGGLILRIKEQDTQGIFHSLGQVPHWRQSNSVGWAHRPRMALTLGRGSQREPPTPPADMLLHCFLSKLNSNLPELKGQNARGGRGERIKEGETQQGQEQPWDPSPELSTVAPKGSQLESSRSDRPHGALPSYRAGDRREGCRAGLRTPSKTSLPLTRFQPITPGLPSPADPERGPHAAASAGRAGSRGQGSFDQGVWPFPPRSAAGTAGPESSALRRTRTRPSARHASPAGM